MVLSDTGGAPADTAERLAAAGQRLIRICGQISLRQLPGDVLSQRCPPLCVLT